jgi:phosphotransferase system  glucose/maltose/N-acetylglucosamine-specific IIC component
LLIYTRKNQGLPWLEAVAAALLVLGTIGQTSMVNTLLHLHTPLTLSLARIAIGLVIGGIVGAVAWAVLKPLLARLRSKA